MPRTSRTRLLVTAAACLAAVVAAVVGAPGPSRAASAGSTPTSAAAAAITPPQAATPKVDAPATAAPAPPPAPASAQLSGVTVGATLPPPGTCGGGPLCTVEVTVTERAGRPLRLSADQLLLVDANGVQYGPVPDYTSSLPVVVAPRAPARVALEYALPDGVRGLRAALADADGTLLTA